jgi:dTDP-glucose 4,6-dehydratase
MTRTLLVTGGAGFIGGNFVLRQIAAGDRIINLDALTYAGNLDTLAPLAGEAVAHTFVRRRALRDRALRGCACCASSGRTAIVNFAAESHVDRSIDGPGGIRANQCGGHA